jgi:hypothetical protein
VTACEFHVALTHGHWVHQLGRLCAAENERRHGDITDQHKPLRLGTELFDLEERL